MRVSALASHVGNARAEKENVALRHRVNQSEGKVVRMSLQGKEAADELTALQQAKQKLEKLCRSLTAERQAQRAAAAPAPGEEGNEVPPLEE